MAENIAPPAWDKENDLSALKTVKKSKSSESRMRRSRRGLSARPNGEVDAGSVSLTASAKAEESENEEENDHTDVIIALPVRSRRSGRRRRRRELVQAPVQLSPEQKQVQETAAGRDAEEKTSDETTFESAIEFKTTKPLEPGSSLLKTGSATSASSTRSSATKASESISSSRRYVAS